MHWAPKSASQDKLSLLQISISGPLSQWQLIGHLPSVHKGEGEKTVSGEWG